MKDQILKLCKRSDKITLDKIVMISEYEESDVRQILEDLISEGKLQNKNGYYYVIKRDMPMQKYSIFNYYTPTLVEIVIKSFCTMIPSYKVAQILGIGEEQAAKFYTIFRETIYGKQLERLKIFYNIKPQHSYNRIFFETEAYFYMYNNEVFISEVKLQSDNSVFFTKEEAREFKRVYSYLKRSAYHNQSKHHLGGKLSEFIWRRNKSFEQLYSELKFLLNA